MLSTEVRAPWWHWALLSLCTTVSVTAVTLAGLIILAFRGVDVLDYIYLAHPPYLSDGLATAVLAGLVSIQTLAPMAMLWLYRPGRALFQGVFSLPGQLKGTALRLGGGVVITLALQAVWSSISPPPAEHWRVAEHLLYAVVGGGSFWPILWVFLALGLVVPVAEEVLFRGIVFGFLRRRWGFMAAAAGSAILFAVPHGPVGAVPTAVLGFYLAYQAERDGSLAGAVALHALNNLGALAVITLGL